MRAPPGADINVKHAFLSRSQELRVRMCLLSENPVKRSALGPVTGHEVMTDDRTKSGT